MTGRDHDSHTHPTFGLSSWARSGKFANRGRCDDEKSERSTGIRVRQEVTSASRAGNLTGARVAGMREAPVHWPIPTRVAPYPATSSAIRFEEAMREAHVPTQQPQAQEEARFSHAHAYSRRSRHHPDSPAAGPVASLGLIRRTPDRATFAALARARRWRRGPVDLRFVALDGGGPRVALAVARHGAPAVTRNRARRRLRAAIAVHAGGLVPDGAYLFGAGPAAATVPFPRLVQAVGELVAETRRP